MQGGDRPTEGDGESDGRRSALQLLDALKFDGRAPVFSEHQHSPGC